MPITSTAQLLTYLFIYVFIHPFIHSVRHSFCSFSHSFIHIQSPELNFACFWTTRSL